MFFYKSVVGGATMEPVPVFCVTTRVDLSAANGKSGERKSSESSCELHSWFDFFSAELKAKKGGI